jgi:hypothetical protein
LESLHVDLAILLVPVNNITLHLCCRCPLGVDIFMSDVEDSNSQRYKERLKNGVAVSRSAAIPTNFLPFGSFCCACLLTFHSWTVREQESPVNLLYTSTICRLCPFYFHIPGRQGRPWIPGPFVGKQTHVLFMQITITMGGVSSLRIGKVCGQ